MENIHISSLGTFDFEHVGWKYYHNIRKKAMEQEFSWSGLALSLSIAFFVVVFTAVSLNIVYEAVSGGTVQAELERRYYRLESPQSFENLIQLEYISKDKIKVLDNQALA